MSKKKPTTSRRGFLRGAGLATAGLALSPHLKAGEPGVADPFVGPDAVDVRLTVNGQQRQARIEARTTLAEVLREDLNMTGTKVVCDRGACSCCTVMLAGEPVCSCLTLAVDVDGREVTTIEGIGTEDNLHPVQEAFTQHDASMCGFCTPGMVMSAVNLLKHNANPSLEDVKTATSGNLCRCGTYPKVFTAVLDAAKTARKR